MNLRINISRGQDPRIDRPEYADQPDRRLLRLQVEAD